MSFLLPSAQTFQADVLKAMASFCHYIFFFPDPEMGAAWTSSHPDTTVISVPDASSWVAGWLRRDGVLPCREGLHLRWDDGRGAFPQSHGLDEHREYGGFSASQADVVDLMLCGLEQPETIRHTLGIAASPTRPRSESWIPTCRQSKDPAG